MKALVVTMILVAFCCGASANDFWVSGGLGVGSRDWAELACASLQLNRHMLLSMRWSKTHQSEQYNDEGGFFSSEGFSPSSSDFGMLLGWVTKDTVRKNSLSFSIGVGQATIVDRGEWLDNWIFPDEWDRVEQAATGLILQGQFFHNNFGMQLFMNNNRVSNFGGVVLCWRVLHTD